MSLILTVTCTRPLNELPVVFRSRSRRHSNRRYSRSRSRSYSHRRKSRSRSYSPEYHRRRSQSTSPMSNRRRHAGNRVSVMRTKAEAKAIEHKLKDSHINNKVLLLTFFFLCEKIFLLTISPSFVFLSW